MPVQVFYENTAITSHYVSRLGAEICADLHRDFLQAKYNWSDQQCRYIAWDKIEMVARRRTQTNQQAVNRGKLVRNWLNLGSQRAEFVNDDDSNHTKQCQADED